MELTFFTGIAAAVFIGATIYAMRRWLLRQRLAFIERYAFHPAIAARLRKKRPELTAEQEALVLRGLRDYFHLCAQAGRRRLVAMPSQVVDDAWHEFILFTRAYEAFCGKALGRYLHHTPAEAMGGAVRVRESIRRAWRLACAKEGINPKTPTRLPLLFALDGLLAIPDGFHYLPDCTQPGAVRLGESGFCASHIGCSSGCVGDSGSSASGFADFGFGSSDGDSGSSCSGGSCGGGGD